MTGDEPIGLFEPGNWPRTGSFFALAGEAAEWLARFEGEPVVYAGLGRLLSAAGRRRFTLPRADADLAELAGMSVREYRARLALIVAEQMQPDGDPERFVLACQSENRRRHIITRERGRKGGLCRGLRWWNIARAAKVQPHARRHAADLAEARRLGLKPAEGVMVGILRKLVTAHRTLEAEGIETVDTREIDAAVARLDLREAQDKWLARAAGIAERFLGWTRGDAAKRTPRQLWPLLTRMEADGTLRFVHLVMVLLFGRIIPLEPTGPPQPA